MKSSPLDRSVSGRRSLPLLCTVQGCERFAFLTMLPLFVLYAQARHGIAAPEVLLILVLFRAFDYSGGLPGGLDC